MKYKKVHWNSFSSLNSRNFYLTTSLFICSVLLFKKKVQERVWGSGRHYDICISYPCKIQIKCTNKQSLGRKGVGVPTVKALHFIIKQVVIPQAVWLQPIKHTFHSVCKILHHRCKNVFALSIFLNPFLTLFIFWTLFYFPVANFFYSTKPTKFLNKTTFK